ncbi:MAG: hypothetical protein DRI46_12670 [Chloroflexi bacterium]|nr:MAG: hypothetical protein DRI46_12670 [Chloroflexota bacterium]
MKNSNQYNTNGVILFEGASLLDGAPIVVIATGLDAASANTKTGGMIQTWILRADMAPTDAVKNGSDASICGDCIHRGSVLPNSIKAPADRSCYVLHWQAPLSVYKAYKNGRYAYASIEQFKNLDVRFGSYGDPSAVPVKIWRDIKNVCSGSTGYSQQWETCDAEMNLYVMASVHSESQAKRAQLKGYRTFRVKNLNDKKLKNEANCPASIEAGHKLTCEQCLACDGANGRRGSITINAHGAPAKILSFKMVS